MSDSPTDPQQIQKDHKSWKHWSTGAEVELDL